MTAWKILHKTTVLSLVLKFPNDSGILRELQICISVQYSLSTAASTHQLGRNGMSSLALVADPTAKEACEWEVG